MIQQAREGYGENGMMRKSKAKPSRDSAEL